MVEDGIIYNNYSKSETYQILHSDKTTNTWHAKIHVAYSHVGFFSTRKGYENLGKNGDLLWEKKEEQRNRGAQSSL